MPYIIEILLRAVMNQFLITLIYFDFDEPLGEMCTSRKFID
jgi:hypothetical protein